MIENGEVPSGPTPAQPVKKKKSNTVKAGPSKAIDPNKVERPKSSTSSPCGQCTYCNRPDCGRCFQCLKNKDTGTASDKTRCVQKVSVVGSLKVLDCHPLTHTFQSCFCRCALPWMWNPKSSHSNLDSQLDGILSLMSSLRKPQSQSRDSSSFHQVPLANTVMLTKL